MFERPGGDEQVEIGHGQVAADASRSLARGDDVLKRHATADGGGRTVELGTERLGCDSQGAVGGRRFKHIVQEAEDLLRSVGSGFNTRPGYLGGVGKALDLLGDDSGQQFGLRGEVAIQGTTARPAARAISLIPTSGPCSTIWSRAVSRILDRKSVV
mgnify:CR=1 FL=1